MISVDKLVKVIKECNASKEEKLEIIRLLLELNDSYIETLNKIRNIMKEDIC